MIKYKNILADIIKDKSNWNELKPELSKYNIDNREKGIKDTSAGLIFEVFTKYYFLTAPEVDGLYSDVWLYDEIPLSVKNKLDLGTVEYGIDLLLRTIKEEFIAVQCKFKNDETSKLNWSSDKISNLFAYCPKADGYIVFSNCASLDQVSLTRQDNFTFYSIGHLLEIEPLVFRNISLLLSDYHPNEKVFFKPRPHQKEAINECVQWFTEGEESRGQLILPCGAGKTFTSLWIKEELKSNKTLVLVPSLALLRQIKNEWSKQRKTKYQYLCVCSEKDIDKDNKDSIVTHTYEIGGNVTTEASKILSFLNQDMNEKVIFSTYQSLPSIINAIENTEISFDFIFCDEAHKTAGISKGLFGLVHDNKKVPAKRRLYATATPRIVKESLKKKLGDDLKYTHDMNDPETFGEEFYRMTFKDAIDEDILVDYKIIAIGVNDLQLANYLQERRFVNDKISIDEVANNYALDYVMNKYYANHALTFHSRVKLAKEFASRHSKLFEKTTSFSVDGTQPTSIRNQILDEFKNSEKAIISNARCLTEGVDVPTIDLVYFSDPKNSKIDIIQAVGRALRKKEGKRLGYIVVPIYHSNNDDVENSISQGSYKNLLQVIRSLCDQDERLQDEINSIAFGKGKRRSKKIDIISSFDEEIDSLHLIGFEDKLRESLFDQIIYKTSNNWDIWFLELKNYLEQNNDYPSKSDNKDLYAWVSQQRNRKKNKKLKFDEIRKLNSINFAWNIVEFKWNKAFANFEKYSKINIFPPCKGIDSDDLVKWYKYQQNCIKDNKIISEVQKNKFLKIDSKFQGPAGRKKWIILYEDLINWRTENPNKWPQYNRSDTKSRESKLYIFCTTIRKRYRENDLGNYWFDKMTEIHFNFEGKTDNWTKRYNKIKSIIEGRKTISIDEIGYSEYTWVYRHKNDLEEGKLSEYKSKKIIELNLDRFFETWEQTFEKVKSWTIENGKVPTKTSNKDFYSWLHSQRTRYKKFGTLSNNQIELLKSIGFDMEGRGNEKKRDRWLEMYENLVAFRQDNLDRWPRFGKDGLEGKLYNWCQANRQAQAGTHSGGKRKPLKQWKVDKLNELGFHWSAEDKNKDAWEENYKEIQKFIGLDNSINIPLRINRKQNPLYTWWRNQKKYVRDGKLSSRRLNKILALNLDLTISSREFKNWEHNLEKLKNFLDENGTLSLPHKENGKVNKLYAWFNNQKVAFRKNKLSAKRILAFENIGIDLKKIENQSNRDGFTKWANRAKEIADFIKENGYYPKVGKDKEQSNLYQSLARTKRAFKNNELSEKQLKLLNELNIEI
jgi:superfamily II DNA or RNA helicase